MNTGIISKRYATALLKYTRQTGRGEQVCAQARAMLEHPDVKPAQLEPDLERFVAFVASKGRMEYIKYIFYSFIMMYYSSVGIKPVRLTMSTRSPETEKRITDLLESRLGVKVMMDTFIDKNLIGGFVLEIDDYLLDASIRYKLNDIRRKFVIKNNRIV